MLRALDQFPTKATTLKTKNGNASLMKIDIFKKVMYYSVFDAKGRMKVWPLAIDRVREVWAANKQGKFPEELQEAKILAAEAVMDFADVTGEIELKELPKKRRKNRRGRGRGQGNTNNKRRNNKSRRPNPNKKK